MSLLDTGDANAGNNGGTGGGSSDGGTGNSAGGSGGQGGATANWRDSLPDELKNNTALSAFSDVTNLAKSYIETKSLVGKKGVFVPGEKASDEEWSSFYKSIGQPELEKFDVKAPENANPEMIGKFKEWAYKAGLTPRQAQKFLDQYMPFEAERIQQAKQAREAEMTEKLEALKKEWGQGYDAQLSIAKKGVNDVLSEETRQLLQETGLHADPTMMRVVAEFSKKVYSEDTIRGEGAGKMGSLTPKEIQSELAGIFSNPAYFDKNHPQHKVVTQKAEELFRMQAG